jgi:hypothetical protein
MPADVWVDRWDRRRTLVTGQALRMVNSACLSALVLSGHVQVWQVRAVREAANPAEHAAG